MCVFIQASRQSAPEKVDTESKKGEDEAVIDPVMQQYMDMVKQQKEKEKQVRVLLNNAFVYFTTKVR